MAKATAPFHALDSETGQSRFFDVDDKVPDHIALTVGAHVLDRKPAAPKGDALLKVTQADLDELVSTKVAEQVGDKQFTQQDVDDAVEAARAALIAELEALNADVDAKGDGADTSPSDPAEPKAPAAADGDQDGAPATRAASSRRK